MGQLEHPDSGADQARWRHRHWYDRLMLLSDGVFAIALTLLAADIAPPMQPGASIAAIWTALGPQLDAYALSAVVIGVFWLAHRRFMAMTLTVDAPVTVITLVMLALVALIPAATRLADHQQGSPAAMLTYSGLVVAIGVACAALWGYAALVAGLVVKEVTRAQRWFFFTPDPDHTASLPSVDGRARASAPWARAWHADRALPHRLADAGVDRSPPRPG